MVENAMQQFGGWKTRYCGWHVLHPGANALEQVILNRGLNGFKLREVSEFVDQLTKLDLDAVVIWYERALESLPEDKPRYRSFKTFVGGKLQQMALENQSPRV